MAADRNVARRLCRNEAQLVALGLMGAVADLTAATAPPPKVIKKRKAPTAPREPTRKSRRSQGATPEYAPSDHIGGGEGLFREACEEDSDVAAARDAARMQRYERLFKRHAEGCLEMPGKLQSASAHFPSLAVRRVPPSSAHFSSPL